MSTKPTPGTGPTGNAPKPQDQRSNVKNPNNPAQKPAGDNRANQVNPNNPNFGKR